jgi:hypothetical protein
MRALACAALILCACRPDSSYVQDMAVSLDLFTGCAPGCDTCLDTEVCYGGALPSQAAFLSATCLTACRTTDDCAPGSHCVIEPSVYGVNGPACMTDALPARCPSSPALSSCAGAPECADSRTLSIEFFPASHAICGRELVACANGCEAAGDDGGSAAHCR